MQDLLIRNLIIRANREEWDRERVVEVFKAVLGEQFDRYQFGSGPDTMGDGADWPVNSSEEILGPDHCGGYHDARPGYSVVACPLLPEGADEDQVYENTRCLPVVEWGIYPNRRDESAPWVLGPNTGCVGFRLDHGLLKGFVHPGGTVITSTGTRLKSLAWWPEFVLSASRATLKVVMPADALATDGVVQEGVAP